MTLLLLLMVFVHVVVRLRYSDLPHSDPGPIPFTTLFYSIVDITCSIHLLLLCCWYLRCYLFST